MTDNIDNGNDDLSQFELEFFQKTSAKEPEDPVELEDSSEDPKDDAEDVEPLATEQEVLEEGKEEDDDPKPEPKKKKSVQERFDEITAARREAEREAEELRRRIAELEAGKAETNKEVKTNTPVINQQSDGPTPDDITEDGEPKYPLGEFDPAFIRDLTRHEFAKAKADADNEQRAAEERRQTEEAKTELNTRWQERVAEVEKEIPDIRQAGVVLDDAFGNIDPGYGEYLANTIKMLDNGPEVLYYLANNVDEAKAIADAGPVFATIALGKLEAQIASAKVKPQPKKVTNAPEPPSARARGTNGRFDVADDTDDLDAFEQKFFHRRR